MDAYYEDLPIDTKKELSQIANKLVAPGKGILCADETIDTVGKRLASIHLQNNENNRRLFRQMLFTTDPEISNYISGVLMQTETFFQLANDGIPLKKHLKEIRGLLIGIKVDKGCSYLSGTNEEDVVFGLGDLDLRCSRYKRKGVDFVKWRAIFDVEVFKPSLTAIRVNANLLAQYANISQKERLVPIIEAEVMPHGYHDLDRGQKVLQTVLSEVIASLQAHHVYLEGVLIKTNIATCGLRPGQKFLDISKAEDFAQATVQTLRRCIPPAVPGILFLSGGANEEQATVFLNEILKVRVFHPWRLTYAFGRALHTSALRCWDGRNSNIKMAQNELMKRAKANTYAIRGEYIPDSFPLWPM